MLVRVVAPHFVAGLVMAGDTCAEAAPIIRWCVGKGRAELRAYFERKGWRASAVAEFVGSPPSPMPEMTP